MSEIGGSGFGGGDSVGGDPPRFIPGDNRRKNMSDEDRRRAQRDVEMHGTDLEKARANMEDARSGTGVLGYLQTLVGKDIYIEGIRINYRGTLRGVVTHGDGRPGGFILNPCQRVSYFQKAGGPQEAYTFVHVGDCLVPYEVCHEVGPDGFVGCNWPRVGAPAAASDPTVS